MTSLPLDSRENYDLCARPGFGLELTENHDHELYNAAGLPKAAAQP